MKNEKFPFKFNSPKLGIIGGGQLGKILSIEAKKLGMYVTILDPSKNCPASSVCDEVLVADFKDLNAIKSLSDKCNVMTYEIELANAEVLEQLETNGKTIHPSAKTLQVIQNKFRQKKFLFENNFSVPRFIKIESFEQLSLELKNFDNRGILKISEGSYDGRGNFVLINKSENEVLQIFDSVKNLDIFLEEWIDFDKELSIMVARNENNDIKTFPISENIHENNILDMSLIPARISNEISIKIEKLAYDVLNKLQGSGVFGIELFLTKSNEILINEIAPRVHNSGHYTIEGCETNQFQQHIRSIFNLPLGSTLLHKPAVMINLLGSNSNDTSFYRFIKELLEIPRLSIHLYGKQEEKFKRKMGHIVIVDEDLDVALQKALEIKKRYLL